MKLGPIPVIRSTFLRLTYGDLGSHYTPVVEVNQAIYILVGSVVVSIFLDQSKKVYNMKVTLLPCPYTFRLYYTTLSYDIFS